MAVLKGGINGPFSGRVGNIVGYELNGQAIVRSLPSRPKRKPTKLAALNQQRMKAVSQFLRPIKPIINWGYKDLAPPGSRIGSFQQAQSYTFKNALDYDGDNNNTPYVNPEKVLLFRGEEQPPKNPRVRREGNALVFEWDPLYAGRHDEIFVAAIYDGAHTFDLLTSGPDLSARSYTWEPFGSTMMGKVPFHVYVGSKNTFTDKLSDSVYLGVV
ncbi:DUF6266 family protein [Sphingobacterium haloxyli]|uniref:Uncharacterized protein n=1 Tax=Sphingobacterium haloxyli TaxID=2100533 RepID=A0A2S9IZW2_9SPHI|nr:DUF6266 family protein [Sphingobacterium haloxyli]PRD46073.1 hypothetical protein C5745_17585 [Sphingobacterium haloxyli]